MTEKDNEKTIEEEIAVHGEYQCYAGLYGVVCMCKAADSRQLVQRFMCYLLFMQCFLDYCYTFVI